MLADDSAPRFDRRALAVGLGAAFVELTVGRAAADQTLDIQVLQTAASVENVLITTYEAFLLLPLVSGPNANPVLKSLMTTAHDQHIEHAIACNDLATKLGGRAQTAPNPGLAQVVARARPSSSDLGQAIDLALQLETASAHTHQNDVSLLGDLNARRLAASIMGVEAQHVSLLLVARALVAGRLPDLLSLDSGTPARLPADAATAGLPDSFAKPDQARPAGEGALR